MKRTLVALVVAALGIVTWSSRPAFAQAAQGGAGGKGIARGTIAALGADSVTLKVRGQEMKFDVTSQTVVEAKGAGTKARAAKTAGNAGPKLSEVLKTGQPVELSYLEADAGALHATRIRAVSSAASASDARPSEMISNGVVKSISNNEMTISGSAGGGAKFTQSFAIDGSTKVIVKGGSTASAATGGKLVVTKAVAEGDHVSVSFHEAGNSLQASAIRVIVKSGARPKA
jgi:hypothetical protein